jgi:hypothetical protein
VPNQLPWVPSSCTLPTVDQPLRVAEFDQLFASALRTVERVAPTHLRLTLDSVAESELRDLTRRESECCSFFAFAIAPAAGEVRVDVTVPATYGDVLAALAVRAETART